MKLTLLNTMLLMCLIFSTGAHAEGTLDQILEKKDTSEASSKKSRRKKVQMCNECGRPETDCECKGEGHGVEEDHHEADREED